MFQFAGGGAVLGVYSQGFASAQIAHDLVARERRATLREAHEHVALARHHDAVGVAARDLANDLLDRALFDGLGADAVTVAPYMGEDSIRPFLDHAPGKWTVVLALTSNPGAQDFEFHGDPPLYERVLQRCGAWGSPDRLMFVVGATRPEQLARARALAPDHFFLVPGVGAQGGSLADVTEAGWAPGCGLLVNASRSILYAGSGSDFASAARAEARAMRDEMAAELARR